jgi:alanine-synthesizing transaminase
LSRDELSQLARLGLPIISDEVFGAYALREARGRMKSVLEAEDCLVFALDGLSKFAGLPQLKLAWITAGGPLALVREAFTGLELVLDTYLSPGGPVQYALSSLLDASALTRRAILARIRHNAATLAEAATGSAVSPLFTEGGWSHAVRLPAVMSEEAWTLGLLGERDVLVQPGYFYDFVEEPVIVLSLLTEEASFEYGVRRLVEYVERAI